MNTIDTSTTSPVRRSWWPGWGWNLTPAEAEQVRPGRLGQPARAVRAVTVRAPAEVMWRWLNQLQVAPYSYDWIDNVGRRSPSHLTPGLAEPIVGDPVMTIFTAVKVQPPQMLELRLTDPVGRRIFGDLRIDYRIETVPAGCRLSATVDLPAATTRVELLRDRLLVIGDLVMMRKQLLTLAGHAERTASTAAAHTGGQP